MPSPADLYADIVTRKWALAPSYLNALLAIAKGIATPKGILLTLPEPDEDPEPEYAVVDGVAIIPVEGLLLKDVPNFYRWYGINATSLTDLNETFQAAVADPGVRAILLAVNSPGGEVCGVADELSDAILAARDEKPVFAHSEDLVCSGAYWIASQAGTILANPSNFAIGSIGVYTFLDDSSKMFLKAGIKTHLIRSGPYKGTGVSGVEITDEELTPYQEEVDQLCARFVEIVARGRGVNVATAASWATGRSWTAEPALDLGLIDGIATFKEAFGAAVKAASASKTTFRSFAMGLLDRLRRVAKSTDPADPPPDDDTDTAAEAPVEGEDTAATDQPPVEPPEEAAEEPAPAAMFDAAELAERTELFGAEFAVKSVTDGVPLDQAVRAHHGVLKAEVADLTQQLADQKAEQVAAITELEQQYAATLQELGVLGEEAAASHSEADPQAEAQAAAAKTYDGKLSPGLAEAAAALKTKGEDK